VHPCTRPPIPNVLRDPVQDSAHRRVAFPLPCEAARPNAASNGNRHANVAASSPGVMTMMFELDWLMSWDIVIWGS
jgi:hypothetical protein